MKIESIKNSIRNVPDFPKAGIQFKDITTLLQDREAFEGTIDIFYEAFKDKQVDTVIGIESRGFIFAAPLALKLRVGFVLIRKPGKLPCETIKKEYALEYGTDAVEIHKDAINKGDRVLIVDDLLATGGTAKAAGELVKELKGEIVSFVFLVKLIDLNGEKLISKDKVLSLIAL